MREYLVWNESGDLLSGPHRKRETAERMEAKFIAECAAECGTDGMDENGNGNFACGVLSPHGIHIQVTEGGYDITGHDY
ncbi:hypothetical protein SEA_PHREDRICK_266 [Streptomyces phage Phredrick]|uniref:Uncharacterized protein n=1 Tax=Streptomyces phage Gilson TaxID=2488789 RepID=A0A3Q9R519_9CAUD|nr:hypothetical protein HWB98_gp024 [Streptomyces phage Gilson]QZE11362.1 hypothetical protein SEA_FORREST_259 [Streptomyces phage Forrest]QZE11592.1 hypothetical protein SEA_JADA_260 [Streptomyces phage Jada]URQ04842.1 hypothetical protein SEA_EMMA1919_261 [Streptomyces phage Emma1919]WNN94819.1 hypothetical protein SEA_PHREDRICK_266 [Streptomyces phage Phredrick]AZU97305.1 hypothetical protein SEA_GILSON_260 [Streptomyces phage Gilson]